MIINTEQVNVMYNGYPTKELRISYIDKTGEISFLSTTLSPYEMFTWDYARSRDVPDSKFRSWDNKPVTRIGLKPGDDLPDTRLQEIIYKLWKQDENFSGVFELNMPHIAYCDIEVEVGEDGFPTAQEAKNPINTVAWVDGADVTVLGRAKLTDNMIKSIQERIDKHCKKFKTRYVFRYEYYESEVDLLLNLTNNYIIPIAALTGWNFLRYDWLYICNRCKNLGIDIRNISPTGEWTTYSLLKLYNKKGKSEKVSVPKHKLLFDYMEVYQKWDTSIYPHESLKLDDVGEASVGVKKVAHSMGFNEMWKNCPEDYVFYNAVDSILVREIDLKLKTASTFFALANLIKAEALVAFSPVRSLQIIQVGYEFDDDKVFPNIKKEEKEKEPYEGAFVYDPIPGAYRNVLALDFASLYPTTMRQFNISPETFVEKNKDRPRRPNEIRTSSGAIYNKDKQGILPKMLTDVYAQRKKYKAEMFIAEQEMVELQEILKQRKENI